ncbi:MAG: hypothetical protein N2V78_07650 [Methanophagales archaeon]|nr:hypothetical protein [Methanophagales archaeon]
MQEAIEQNESCVYLVESRGFFILFCIFYCHSLVLPTPLPFPYTVALTVPLTFQSLMLKCAGGNSSSGVLHIRVAY